MPRKRKHKKPSHRRRLERDGLWRRRTRIGIELISAILFFVALLYAKEYFIDHSIIGEQLRQASYNISQTWLRVNRDAKRSDVVVVNIGELQPCKKLQPNGNVTDPLASLEKAVSAVMAENPTAIGIDIDFSPGAGIKCDPITEADRVNQELHSGSDLWFTDRGGPVFFEFCLNQERPIFLGVYRSEKLAPRQWLNSIDYAELAAAIILPPETTPEGKPVEDLEGVHKSMALQILNKEANSRLNSLSYALAAQKPRNPSWLERQLERIPNATFPVIETVDNGDGIVVEKFLVDFSALQRLQETTINFDGEKLAAHSDSLSGKLVLLGNTDTEESSDKFIAAAGESKQVAGVFWHASAVDTLQHGVLRRPTPKGEKLLDAIAYLPIVLFIAVIRLAYSREPKVHIAQHRIESIGTKIAALLVLMAGTYFVSTTRLMWDGFLMVTLITALHPTIERYVKSGLKWLLQKGKPRLPNLFFERE